MKLARLIPSVCLAFGFSLAVQLHAQEKLNVPPPSFKALFNGKDLTGWKGLPLKPNMNVKKKETQPFAPMTMPERLKASPEELAEAHKRGDESAHKHWKVEDGVI